MVVNSPRKKGELLKRIKEVNSPPRFLPFKDGSPPPFYQVVLVISGSDSFLTRTFHWSMQKERISTDWKLVLIHGWRIVQFCSLLKMHVIFVHIRFKSGMDSFYPLRISTMTSKLRSQTKRNEIQGNDTLSVIKFSNKTIYIVFYIFFAIIRWCLIYNRENSQLIFQRIECAKREKRLFVDRC